MQVDRIQHRIINSAQLADFILCFDMNARLVFALRNTFIAAYNCWIGARLREIIGNKMIMVARKIRMKLSRMAKK